MPLIASADPSTARPSGWSGKAVGLEMIEDDVVGRVVRLADLLKNDAALAFQLFGLEGRMGQDIADDVEPSAVSSFSSLT